MSAWQFNNYTSIFRIKEFRLFWSGFTLSEIGDAMTRVALTWYVYESTHSAEALGWLAFAYTGPVMLGGLLAGPLLDRFDRPMVMLVDNLLRGLAVASVPLLYALDLLSLPHVYLVAVVYGLMMMISLAGGPTLIPSLVEERHLATANALETLTFTLSGVLGPVLAGLLIVWVGAPYVLVFDALSYGVFAIALLYIKRGRTTATASVTSAFSQSLGLSGVVRFATKNPVLLSTTLMFAAANLGQGFVFVWLPILADRMTDGGSTLYGLLLGVWGAGEVVGALIAGSTSLRTPLGTLICVSQVLCGLSLGIFLVDQSLWFGIPAFALMGVFSAPLTIWAQTLRMLLVPAEIRGRAFALLRTVMQSAPPIGGAIAGLLLPIMGIPAMISASALFAGLPGLLGLGVRQLRTAGAPNSVEVSGSAEPLTAAIDYVSGE